jgi:hypothetical protein
MSSRVPRKQRNLKAAASASAAAGVETNSSNCTEGDVISEASNYELFGFGKAAASYTQGQITDFASISDQEKQVTAVNSTGIQQNLKDQQNIIATSIGAGLSTSAPNYYFSGNSNATAVTGTAVVNFVYGKSGPEAGYIPALVQGGGGLTALEEYIFFLPSSVTGAAGANMPAGISASFQVDFAGALAAGESIQVYTASAAGARVATGSAFTYSGSICSTPNFSASTVVIPTSSLAGTGQAGIVIIYTASYTEDGTKDNTPYAGIVATIRPSSLLG